VRNPILIPSREVLDCVFAVSGVVLSVTTIQSESLDMSRLLPALLFTLLLPGIVLAQGEFETLLKRVPASANSILVIDVEALLESPLAVKEGWKEQQRATYTSQPLILPPEGEKLIVASQMAPHDNFSQAWELGLMTLSESMPVNAMARAEGGYVDELSGKEVVWSPSDAYFVPLEDDHLAVIHPAIRQPVARWIEAYSASTKVSASEYLAMSVSDVTDRTQIVMALDLKNVPRPHVVADGLEGLDYLKDAQERREWLDAIMSIQGVKLKVSVGSSVEGSLQVDFGNDVSALHSKSKELILNSLDKYGLSIDELEAWKSKNGSTSLGIEGPLSTSALRKIVSLIELPSAKFSQLKGTESSSSTPDVGKASRDYFQSVETLLDDLRSEFESNKDARRTMASAYMEKYARRIDRLPILNVDEELLAYGAMVGETLRGASVSQRMSGVKTGVRKSEVYTNYGYGYDYRTRYGSTNDDYYATRSKSSQKNQIQREEDAKARQVRFDSWKEVEDATAAIRKSMTQKYQLEF